jgi:hypothetical protein
MNHVGTGASPVRPSEVGNDFPSTCKILRDGYNPSLFRFS